MATKTDRITERLRALTPFQLGILEAVLALILWRQKAREIWREILAFINSQGPSNGASA